MPSLTCRSQQTTPDQGRCSPVDDLPGLVSLAIEEGVPLGLGHLQRVQGSGSIRHSSDQVLTGWPVSPETAVVLRE